METIDVEKMFETSEFGLATALISYGFQLEYLDRHIPDRVEFGFKKEQGLERVSENFWKGSLMVNAVNYYNAFKLLKARLRNERK